jgi:CheY-like chemotaxis protein
MQQLDSAGPDLILLDIHLPHVSGADILQRIRSDARLAHIPVVVVTADQRVPPSIEEQADHVLTKSLGISQLRSLLIHLRQRHESDMTELLQNPGEAI